MVSHAVMQNGWYRFVPLLAFLAVYTITCLTGAIFFCWTLRHSFSFTNISPGRLCPF